MRRIRTTSTTKAPSNAEPDSESAAQGTLGESLDSFERQVRAYEGQSGKPIPDETLAATVIAGIDNVTVAQHLAPNDGNLDTHPKIMEAVRTFVRASRGWNVSSEGDPMDVDAVTKGKGKDKKGKSKGHEKGKSSKSESKDATDNQADKECFYCKFKGCICKTLCRKRINDGKAEAGQHRDNLKGKGAGGKQRVAALETGSAKSQAESVSPVPMSSLLLTPAQLPATYAQMAKHIAATASTPVAQCEAI